MERRSCHGTWSYWAGECRKCWGGLGPSPEVRPAAGLLQVSSPVSTAPVKMGRNFITSEGDIGDLNATPAVILFQVVEFSLQAGIASLEVLDDLGHGLKLVL